MARCCYGSVLVPGLSYKFQRFWREHSPSAAARGQPAEWRLQSAQDAPIPKILVSSLVAGASALPSSPERRGSEAEKNMGIDVTFDVVSAETWRCRLLENPL